MFAVIYVNAQNSRKSSPLKDRISFYKGSPSSFTANPGKPGVPARSINAVSGRINEFKAADIKRDPKAFKQMLLDKRNQEKQNIQSPVISAGNRLSTGKFRFSNYKGYKCTCRKLTLQILRTYIIINLMQY
jgi:hypothetical protein